MLVYICALAVNATNMAVQSSKILVQNLIGVLFSAKIVFCAESKFAFGKKILVSIYINKVCPKSGLADSVKKPLFYFKNMKIIQ